MIQSVRGAVNLANSFASETNSTHTVKFWTIVLASHCLPAQGLIFKHTLYLQLLGEEGGGGGGGGEGGGIERPAKLASTFASQGSIPGGLLSLLTFILQTKSASYITKLNRASLQQAVHTAK